MDTQWLIKKTGRILQKGPATARNMALSKLDIWPVRRLRNADIRRIPVYCISMPHETRRQRIITKQVETLGFESFQFVEGFRGKDYTIGQLEKMGLYDDQGANKLHNRSLNPSEIGATISHCQTYEKIRARGHDIALVIEDDCLFMPSRLDSIRLADLPEGWDIAFLNSFIENGRPRRRIAGNLFEGDAYTGSAAAYFLSRKGIETLATGWKPVVLGADGYTGRNDIKRYMYYPDCALNGSVAYYYNSAVDFVRPK